MINFQNKHFRSRWRWCLIAIAFLASSPAANAFRPFIATDAAVADFHEVELEMGYFGFSRNGNDNTFIVPQTVLNHGLFHRMEAVAQVDVDKTNGTSVQLGEPSLSVKVVAKKGFLQDKPGDSLAFETAVLPSSVVAREHRTGFQETGIWSHALGGMIFHFNLGGGLDQLRTDVFFILGDYRGMPREQNVSAGRRSRRSGSARGGSQQFRSHRCDLGLAQT